MLDAFLVAMILFLTWRYIAICRRNDILKYDLRAEREDALFWMRVVDEMEETGGTSRLLNYRREGHRIVQQALENKVL